MTREEAQAYVKVRHDAVQLTTEVAGDGAAKAQQRQATQANKKRREPDFDVGDYVDLTPKGFTTSRPSAKLDQQMQRPLLLRFPWLDHCDCRAIHVTAEGHFLEDIS